MEPASPGLHSQPYSLLPLLSALTCVPPSAHLLSRGDQNCGLGSVSGTKLLFLLWEIFAAPGVLECWKLPLGAPLS